jgi:predicted nucleic acid-binding protein
LFYLECANILWKYTRRFNYPAGNARQDVRDLRALALRTVSAADLLEPALELALAYDLTVYDAAYAALAQQLGLPLITVDETLWRKLSGSGITVRTLAALDEE